MTSALGNWCTQGLVVPSGVGSGGRRGLLSITPNGIGLVSTGYVRIVKIDLMQNYLDPLSPLSQTDRGLNQVHNPNANSEIYPLVPGTTSSCVGSTATD